MKKLSLLLVLLLALCAFAGCSDAEKSDVEAPKGTVGVTNDAIHFSVCYPQSWICDRNDGTIKVSPPGDSSSKASVSVHESTALAMPISAENYWNDVAKPELEGQFGAGKYNFIEGKETTLGGEKAWRVVYVVEIGGSAYKVTQTFAYKNIDSSDRIFTVTFTGTEDDYNDKEVLKAHDTVLNNFAFKN